MIKIIELANALGEKPYKVELRELGYNYCDIGGFIAEQWNLPAGIPETILYHQDPATAPDHQFETSIIHVARVLSEFADTNIVEPEFDAVALSTLDLSQEEIISLYEQWLSSVNATVSSFGGARKAA